MPLTYYSIDRTRNEIIVDEDDGWAFAIFELEGEEVRMRMAEEKGHAILQIRQDDVVGSLRTYSLDLAMATLTRLPEQDSVFITEVEIPPYLVRE